jgi:adenylate cyclase class 2
MAREIEVKAKCADCDAVRRRLAALGARLSGSGFERNVCFDAPDGRLRESDSLLRLREYNGTILTFKGPREHPTHGVKSREEVEVVVDNFDATVRILCALGFVKVWAYEKNREEWDLDGAKVCLDVLPVIGEYMEVEGASESEVMSVFEKLGVGAANITPRTYVELFRSAIGAADWKLPDMVFEDKEGR